MNSYIQRSQFAGVQESGQFERGTQVQVGSQEGLTLQGGASMLPGDKKGREGEKIEETKKGGERREGENEQKEC